MAREKSPYLLQHSENPVDWYPWCPEAFERAKSEGKPVFLSIGYSTCHWCHVMAHESFEDDEIAGMMNDAFVSIKVDREERPDIDSLYMKVCQATTGSGGWPLTIVMTPDGKPFFAGTYFPKNSRLGLIGMRELIPRILEVWNDRREEVESSADRIVDSLRSSGTGSSGKLDEGDLDAAFHQLSRAYDDLHGGFGSSPKFPTPHNLAFLLRYWKRRGEPHALDMVEKTLRSMRNGGIFDQLGLGFHRYSTDPIWLVPHFEKMLYDQALLALVYLEAFQATGREEYADTAREIFTYVIRDMKSPEGAFFSGEDADSEGEEGKFYVWSEDEIRSILDEEDANFISEVFGITGDGNFEGSNILFVDNSIEDVARNLGVEIAELKERLERAKEQLLAVRNERIRPFKDDKILTDWNGLIIAALARGSRVLDDENYGQAAEDAMNFFLSRMLKQAGRLLHRYRDGEAAIDGTLDDYAFLILALIELYEATFKPRYMGKAIELMKVLIEYFWDSGSGGFYLTPDDGEELIARQKEGYDGAIPSGNSVAMLDLLRLGRMTGDSDMEERAIRLGNAFSDQVVSAPMGYTQMLSALDFVLGPSFEIVLVGDPGGEDMRGMVQVLRKIFLPNKVVLVAPVSEPKSEIYSLATYLNDYKPLDGRATAYVCQNYVCREPMNDHEKLVEILTSWED